MVVNGKVSHLRHPEIGDEVVFNRASSKKTKLTPGVSVWGFAANFELIQQLFNSLPIYRVIGAKEHKVIWKGQNLDDFRKQFSNLTSNLSNSAIKGRYKWQSKKDRNTQVWKDCSNPLI